jgi:uncharacterized protein
MMPDLCCVSDLENTMRISFGLYPVLLWMAAASAAFAETVTIEIPRIAGIENSAALTADLMMPQGLQGRVPAVVVLHSAGGIDGASSSYVSALNQAGMATLEVRMFARGGAIPFKDSLPYAYASLAYLARQPTVDPSRIAILGFSYGGILAILTASADETRAFAPDGQRFAAHVSLYPVCWIHEALSTGTTDLRSDHTNKFLRGITAVDYQRMTGAPVLLLAGEKDQYDDPDSCPRFVSSLPTEAKALYTVVVYSGAYHGWNAVEDRYLNDPAAYKGRGGRVSQFGNKEITAKSRDDVLTFLKTKLASTR